MKLDAEKNFNKAMNDIELNMGITLKEAAEKQIPQGTLYNKKENDTETVRVVRELYSCPRCKKVLFVQNEKREFDKNGEPVVMHRFPDGERTKYCHNCGQRLKWNGE